MRCLLFLQILRSWFLRWKVLQHQSIRCPFRQKVVCVCVLPFWLPHPKRAVGASSVQEEEEDLGGTSKEKNAVKTRFGWKIPFKMRFTDRNSRTSYITFDEVYQNEVRNLFKTSFRYMNREIVGKSVNMSSSARIYLLKYALPREEASTTRMMTPQ